MLELKVQVSSEQVVLRFEHSLLSLSKWESKNKTPFMSRRTQTAVDMVDYFQDMLLGDVDSTMVYRLSPEQLDELSNYINDPMTASSVPKAGSSTPEVVTSELIYYWMTALSIDWSAESWHLNRLMMLIQITNYKSQPEKKKSQADMMTEWRKMNDENQELYGAEAG